MEQHGKYLIVLINLAKLTLDIGMQGVDLDFVKQMGNGITDNTNLVPI